MKKNCILFLFAVAMIAVKSNAQTTFGLTIGSSVASFHTKADDEKDKTNSKAGLMVGVLADIPISEVISFQPALNFVQKGGSQKESFLNNTYKMQVKLNYLEMPLNINYKAPGGFFVGAGPSLSYGLSGKSKVKGSDGSSEEEKVNFGNSIDDDIKPFEFAGNLQAGYVIKKKMMVSANYNFGLSNLATEGEGSFKNNYFGLKIGFLFP